MSTGFADFTDLSTGAIVHVNPNAVRAVSPTPDGHTIVQFDATHQIFVGGKVEDVMKKLREAAREVART